MPIDPSIPLQVNIPQVQPFGGPLGLVDMMSKFADIQNKQNENKLFQQTYKARQEAGAILAVAPDLGTALSIMGKNPDIAPFAGDIMTNLQGIQTGLANMTAVNAGTSRSVLEAFIKSLPGAMADPRMLRKLANAQLATVAEGEAKKNADAGMDSTIHALTDDLPPEREKAASLYQKRLGALLTGYGITQEILVGVIGGVENKDVGPGYQPTMTAPILGAPYGTPAYGMPGGSSKPVGPMIPKTGIAPALTTVTGKEGESVPGVVTGSGEFNQLRTGPGVTTPSSRAKPNALGGGSPIVGPTIEKAAEAGASGPLVTSLEERLNRQAEEIPFQLKRISRIEGDLKKFQSGMGASWRQHLGETLQFFKNLGMTGIEQKTIDGVANGDLAAIQQFDAAWKGLITKQLSYNVAGQGQVMSPEVKAALESANPNIDPNALMEMIDRMKDAIRVDFDQSEKYLDFKKLVAKKDPSVDGLSLRDFPNWYTTSQRPEVDSEMKKTPTAGVKGVEQPGGDPYDRHVILQGKAYGHRKGLPEGSGWEEIE